MTQTKFEALQARLAPLKATAEEEFDERVKEIVRIVDAVWDTMTPEQQMRMVRVPQRFRE